MTTEELELYALENILESDSVEAFEKMQAWIKGVKWAQENMNREVIEEFVKFYNEQNEDAYTIFPVDVENYLRSTS